jgi:hypothetical protein
MLRRVIALRDNITRFLSSRYAEIATGGAAVHSFDDTWQVSGTGGKNIHPKTRRYKDQIRITRPQFAGRVGTGKSASDRLLICNLACTDATADVIR